MNVFQFSRIYDLNISRRMRDISDIERQKCFSFRDIFLSVEYCPREFRRRKIVANRKVAIYESWPRTPCVSNFENSIVFTWMGSISVYMVYSEIIKYVMKMILSLSKPSYKAMKTLLSRFPEQRIWSRKYRLENAYYTVRVEKIKLRISGKCKILLFQLHVTLNAYNECINRIVIK